MSGAAKVMRYTVVVRHPETDAPTALLAGKVVPSWAKDLVHGDDLVESGQPDTSQDAGNGGSGSGEPTEPPRAGRGSGLDAWQAYAEATGLDVPEDASREDIQALVDARNGA